MSPTSYPYQIGGSLSVDAPCYVERPADTMLYEALLAGEFCYVLNARQMGKSSLLVRTKQRLEEKGIRCVALDLTGIGGLNTTPEQWYKGLFVQICLGLKLLKKIKFKVWWQDHADLPLAQRIILFIRDILLTYIPDQPIVIFIDEIDTVLGLPFPGDDFFDLIRFCFNQRSVDSQFTRITFALFGVANPATLIQDPRRTPFNIGRAIPLTGFSLSQTDPLMGGLPLPHDIAFESLSAILTWTGGQPFLTHKLCQIVRNYFAANPCQPISDVVAKLVQSNIIENWQTQDNPEHLSTIANRILSNPQTAGRLLGIYQRILASNVVKFDHSPEHIELLLSGIVINQDETLQIKNRIYESVFTPQWVQQKLEQIRPYAQQFNAWVSSHQQRTDHLLRGPVLKEALAWAQDKQLSDVDYRFLGASQTLASQLAKQALAEEKQERELAELMVRSLQTATQIFSEARQTAKRQSRKAKLGQGWLGGIAAGVTGGVLLLRLAGLLQGMEWAAFDQLVKHRPVQGIDPRITMITVDEPDIRAAGSFPLSGQVLADLLERLNRYEPRVIGFDIYRDVPVEPGHDAFVQALARSPNVIGIEQVIEPSIEALPVLAAQNQVGFGDQIVDGDGIIRRALMSISAKDETSLHLSFSLQLALKYLTTENITPESLDDGSTQLGQAALKPFEPNTSGFYVGAEDGGYQMLLNYHGPITDFQHLSLTQVLAGEIDPDI
ncbi:MAG: CHASE2 domain-containing protein, partial [Cyanobacteria bacterium J06635_15]